MKARKISVTLLMLSTLFATSLTCRNQAKGNADDAQPTVLASANSASADSSTSNPDSNAVTAQNNEQKSFHGTVGERSVTMQITRSGNNLTGTYYYDGIGKNLVLKGTIDQEGSATLQEFDERGKQTGKFSGKFANDEIDDFLYMFSGTWTTPTGGGETMFSLTEQDNDFTGGLRVETKLISDRRRNISVAYPQLVGTNSAAVARFNQRITSLVMKDLNAFRSERNEPGSERGYFDANYNILLGTNDLVSVEINEDFYGGGAHPDLAYVSLTFDLQSGREVQLASLFKPQSNYKKVIQQKSYESIKRRILSEDRKSAQPGQQPNEDIGIPEEELENINGWAMTSRGIVVYYDLAHVIAAFDRVFIPYGELADILNPQGPAGRFARTHR